MHIDGSEKEPLQDEEGDMKSNEDDIVDVSLDSTTDGIMKERADGNFYNDSDVRYIQKAYSQKEIETLLGIDYPSWSLESELPLTSDEILEIFDSLTHKFGFQESSKINIYHLFMSQLDSRASRTTPLSALISLHVSYIGGEHANYRKWYFAAQLDLDEEIGFQNMKLHGRARKRNSKLAKKRGVSIKEQISQWRQREQEFVNSYPKITFDHSQLKDATNLTAANYRWKLKMKDLTPKQMVRQVALYLLCWGEANQLRFAPECLCYIFKCAMDYDTSETIGSEENTRFIPCYLDDVISPLYYFIRDQLFEKKQESLKWIRKSLDHNDIIGYDDINQLFWYPEGIERIVLKDGQRLVDIPMQKRYLFLKDVVWSKAFYKTYIEKRSWMHCITNFNRFWIIHLAPFWFFTSFNSPTLYTKNYIQLLDNQPTMQARLSVMAFGGSITCLIQIFATIFEWQFVPRTWPGAQHLTKRFIGLILCLLINFGPSIYIFGFFDLNVHSKSACILSICQLIIAVFTTFFFAIRPLGGLFGTYFNKSKNKRRYISSQTFTASFPKLSGRSRLFSCGLWIFVFIAKYVESYFFLTLSLKDPIRALSILDLSRCRGDFLLGRSLCRWQSKITLLLILLSDLTLFFLDTYLWYIICNCVFSIVLSFSLGVSTLTPWKNIYSRLPKRIYSKILATSEMDIKYKPKILISQIWNAIIISMYREHLLSVEHVQKLIFQQVDSMMLDIRTLRSPTFFIAQDDSTFKSLDFFPSNSEAKRRISFFAQSLSTPLLDPVPVECMPTFTVLIPHYTEKILLGLREIIREESQSSKITVLEYLKYLHPEEWDCFVKDTKILSAEKKADQYHTVDESSNTILNKKEQQNQMFSSFESVGSISTERDLVNEQMKDMPYRCFGFCSSENIYTIRTRIWASLRSQTLYRTITGFMNYSKAIKLLYRIENPSMVALYGDNVPLLENDIESMSNRKFKMIVAMQRYLNFDENEREGVELLLKAFPYLCISFLEAHKEGDDKDLTYYSCLTNGNAPIDPKTNFRTPIYRIKLSGNPILGDGKSDNQNHSIIFYRGEYIQVIDANQDNYLEECLKIRSILREFEEYSINTVIPYIPGIDYAGEPAPVAIVGAREYIFSENIGVLGDIAAGKEQTFGTLFARTLAEIGGKLHYGHPDFINAIFMTTRGGLSKAQKGLHLNEDIYAGMIAICRGGKIKHSDYVQCGKGRDLGFNSILNFTTKIGAGMGEQLLSREYYYLGTQLPMDRFLSFFYAHPGFHLNNLFISLSLHLFFMLLINLGSLNHETILCHYDRNKSITSLQIPIGCYNLTPALHWISIFVFSIFIVFFIAFAPLFVQELLEKGIWKSILRILHHLLSMAPLFEVFVCQIYSNSILSNLTFGGAKYISTGRGLAITRISFPTLYSRFAIISIYSGIQIFLMLVFASASMWQPALLWFWISVVSLCFAPVLFNPHQFSFMEFFIDYQNFYIWLATGNSKYVKESWATFTKSSRSRFTGFKRKTINDVSEDEMVYSTKTRVLNVFFSELFCILFVLVFDFTAYTFMNAQTGVKRVRPSNSVMRLVVVTILPILLNMVILFGQGILSVFIFPVISCCSAAIGNQVSFVTHLISVIIYAVDFELMWFLEGWNFPRTLILLITAINLHIFLFRLVTIILVTKEHKANKTNIAWWTGKWYNTGFGWSIITQPFREYIIKVMEMSYFAGDFVLGHFILFLQAPIILIPFIDCWHSMTLFWLRPTNLIRGRRVFGRKQSRRRRNTVIRYFFFYFLTLAIFIGILLTPYFAHKFDIQADDLLIGTILDGIIQPNNQNNNDTGARAPPNIMRSTPKAKPVKTVS